MAGSYFDESFWASVAEIYSPASTERDVDFLLAVTSAGRPGRLLDLGCGEGRHAALLAGQGWRVVGVDNYLPALRRARQKTRGLDVSVVAADMRLLPLLTGARFDVIAFMQNTFGYFSDAENVALLRDTAARLVPGGWIYLDCANVDAIDASPARTHQELHGERRYTYTVTFDYPTSRLRIEVSVHDGYQAAVRRSGDFRVFRPAELATLLRVAGFEQVRLYGDFRPAGPVTPQDRYVQAVGRRPGAG